jgi:hypothetical protein
LKASTIKSFYLKTKCFPFDSPIDGEKGENFGQTIWDKSVVLFGIRQGKHIDNMRNMVKAFPPPQKRWALLSSCSVISIKGVKPFLMFLKSLLIIAMNINLKNTNERKLFSI